MGAVFSATGVWMRASRDVQNSGDKPDCPQFETALNALAKALKAMNFYPPEHPLRNESISSAFSQITALFSGKELVFIWSKDACTLEGRPPVRNNSATARSLAREMLTRKLQRLIILPGLTSDDLKVFLAILTTEADHINSKGGIEAYMISSGIKTICANEVNLLPLAAGSGDTSGTESGATPSLQGDEGDGGIGGENTEPTSGSGGSQQSNDKQPPPEESAPEEAEAPLDLQFSKLGMDILLGMLKAENRESQFLQLAREVVDSAEDFKRTEAFDALLPVIEALIDIYTTSVRPPAQKEFIKYALEQIASGGMTVHLLDRIEVHIEDNDPLLNSICSVIGQSLAYPLIQRLCVAESLHARKAIAIALTRSGEAAISALIAMLKDERWYVVRNMVTILGEIVSPESVKALKMVSQHPEPKVRKEVVKALIKINPQASEAPLIAMLAESDRDVLRQVIFSLGAIRSKAALRPLLEIVSASDTFLKELELKKMAVSALGRIGDRQATEPLLDLLSVKGWLAPRRWLELKIAAANALGQLGDESALPRLKKLSASGSDLGKACSEATDNIERVLK